MKQRMLVPAAVLAAVTAWPLAAPAQPIDHGRGNIVSIDRDNLTIQFKDPKGQMHTWKYVPDATVKFTDQTEFYPHPTVNDLRPPMYVHYTATQGVIQTFDVVEVGFKPGSSASDAKTPGVSRTVTGRVTSYTADVRQVELDINGRRETFQLTPRADQRLNPGDRVELRTAWTGPTELVTEVRVLGGGDTGGGRPSSGIGGAVLRNPAGGRSGNYSAEGRVVRITSSGVVMQVAGGEQTYEVDDSRTLQRLRVGDTVTFDWRTDRNGRMYITSVR